MTQRRPPEKLNEIVGEKSALKEVIHIVIHELSTVFNASRRFVFVRSNSWPF